MTKKLASYFAGGLCALLLSCGEQSIELSTPPRIEPSTEPSTLGSINEHISALVADEQRLYWIGSYAAFNWFDSGAALHSCSKQHCADSLVTYDASHIDIEKGFGLHDNEIFWTNLTPQEYGSNLQFVSCPITGCQGTPRALLQYDGARAQEIAYGSDAIYFSDGVGSIFRTPYMGNAQPLEIAHQVGWIQGLTAHGDYLYAFEYLEKGVTLRRLRMDGSLEFETLAEHLKVILSPPVTFGPTAPYANLAFDATFVYWTSNTLTGSIARCPLTGCVGAPEVLAASIRAPTALHLDGTKAYFQYDDTFLGNSLTSCVLAHCEPSAPIVSGLEDWNLVAIDEQYVYTAATQQKPVFDLPWDYPSAQIRRFSK